MAIPSEQSTAICTNCDKAIPAPNIDVHFAYCSRNLERCKFCREMVPKRLAEEHYINTHAPEVCGNRTENCHLCGKYIRVCERSDHETSCPGSLNGTAGTSRDMSATEREKGTQRRRRLHDSSRKHIMFTIAMTGIAVVLGSIFFRRKTDSQKLHKL